MKNRLIVFLFFTVPLSAQTVAELTDALTKNVANDSLKVVCIYDWVTKNISYDHRFMRNRVEGDTALYQEPNNVILRKKAICMGYAKLVKAMCQYAGIEAVVVDGFTKSTNDNIDAEEHAWNAVRIRDIWYLMDATWDESLASVSQKYFLSPPSVFLEKHYPHDPMWQLIDKPKSFECFKQEKNCVPNDVVFSYGDTIKAHFRKDSIAQLIDGGQRALRFFSDDVEAIRNIANGHSGYAFEAYNAYHKMRENMVSKKNKPVDSEKVLKLLDVIEYHLKQARAYYDQLAGFAKKNEITDAHYNREMMLENLEKLAEERQFVKQFFKK